jgi:signal transduction histidine kinase
MSHEHLPRPPWTRPHRMRVVGPLVLAAFAVVGTVGAGHSQPDRRPVDALAVLLVVAGPASLVWLRRWPRPVTWFVGLVTLAYLLVGYPYGPVLVTLVVTVVLAVATGHRLTAWLVVATVLAGHFLLRGTVSGEPWSWGQVLGVTAWALVALAAAEIVRVRRDRALTWRRAAEETRRRQAGEERLRIAQELHDVVAHHMSLINVQASVALHLAGRSSQPVEPALEAIKAASKEALTEMRALVGVLRDDGSAAPRSPAATLEALDELVERSRHAGLDVRRQVEGESHRLPAAVELAAFRITQEAITNVVRHSGAQHATIRLEYGADELTVAVEDDGRGSGGTDLLPGNGIRGMRERATALGGSLEIGPAPAGGLSVRARLPVEPSP